MKCPMMFGTDAFGNGRECIGNACMWRVEIKDSHGGKCDSCAVPILVVKPGLSVAVQPCDKLFETKECR